MDELGGTEYAKYPDAGGGIALMHLLRLIWQCLLTRAEASTIDEPTNEWAFQDAMEKIDPFNLAILIRVLETGDRLVSLERGIMEGIYPVPRYELSMMKSWLNRSHDQQTANSIEQILQQIPPIT